MSASAQQSAQPHAALIWLIRGTGALMVIPSAILILFTVVVMPILIIINPHRPTIDWMQIGIGASLLIMGLLFYGFIAKVGYDMFRKVDAIAVSNFAFIFSILTARALYHLLPLSLPKTLSGYVCDDAPFLAKGQQLGISYRATLAFFAFFIFYYIVKAFLLRILELNASKPPQNPTPSDSSGEEAFVPFDPYDLSKNRPARPQ